MKILLLTITLVSCGGSSQSVEQTSNSASKVSPKDAKIAAFQKEMDKRQVMACEKYAVMRTECVKRAALAVPADHPDAKEAHAAANDPRVLDAQKAEFVRGCTSKRMSSRQIGVLETCELGESCTDYQECLRQLNRPVRKAPQSPPGD